MPVYEVIAANESSKYTARMGKAWDDEEIVKLLQSIRKKKSIEDIAKEHERTIGAINSRRRDLAADYWFNDKRPIEEIMNFTGLTKEQIEGVIRKRTATKECLIEDPQDTSPDMKDIIPLLKDIQKKLSIIIEKIQ